MSRSAEQKSRSGILTFTIGLVQLAGVVAVVGGTILVSNYMRDNQPDRVQVETRTFTPIVQTGTVTAATRIIPLRKTGSVEPTVYVNIAPEVSGVVEGVKRGLGGGATFEEDEVLFQVSRTDLEIELRRRQADLDSSVASLDIERAQAENARREWESFGRGDITDLAARGPQVRSAEAQVLIAETQVEIAELNLERASYALPFAGRIVELSLAPGQRVSAGQSYGRVYSFDSVEVAVALSPDELALLDRVNGAPAHVEGRALGKSVSLTGTVIRVDGEVDRTTRLSTVIIGLDADEVRTLGLQPGTFVTVTLEGSEVEGVAEVPNAALQEDDRVWLVEDGRLRLSEDVQVVLRGRGTTLVTGLNDGARFVMGTVAGATDGMAVEAAPEPVNARTRAALTPETGQ